MKTSCLLQALGVEQDSSYVRIPGCTVSSAHSGNLGALLTWQHSKQITSRQVAARVLSCPVGFAQYTTDP